MDAEGPTYLYEEEGMYEILNLFDSGAEFGDDGISGMNGFRFTRDKNEGNWRTDTYTFICGLQNPFAPDMKKADAFYANAEDQPLEFQGFGEVKTEFDQMIQAIGIPQLVLANAYSIVEEDVDTYIESMTKELEKETLGDGTSMDWETMYLGGDEFDKENEAYLLLYRQEIDGIPIIERLWSESVRDLGAAPYTYVTALKSANGSVKMEAAETIHFIVGEGEEEVLITYEEALKKVKDKYAYNTNAVLHDAGLRYIALEKDGAGETIQYDLIPAWCFEISTENEVDGYAHIDYSMEVINAMTGEKIDAAG